MWSEGASECEEEVEKARAKIARKARQIRASRARSACPAPSESLPSAEVIQRAFEKLNTLEVRKKRQKKKQKQADGTYREVEVEVEDDSPPDRELRALARSSALLSASTRKMLCEFVFDRLFESRGLDLLHELDMGVCGAGAVAVRVLRALGALRDGELASFSVRSPMHSSCFAELARCLSGEPLSV